ncbi:hypothetical protein Dimus_001064 [Dionaea muscipula]
MEMELEIELRVPELGQRRWRRWRSPNSIAQILSFEELPVVWTGLRMKIEEENSEPRSENREREEENTYPGHRRGWSGGDGGTASSPVIFVVAGGLVEELELGELSMEMALTDVRRTPAQLLGFHLGDGRFFEA